MATNSEPSGQIVSAVPDTRAVGLAEIADSSDAWKALEHLRGIGSQRDRRVAVAHFNASI